MGETSAAQAFDEEVVVRIRQTGRAAGVLALLLAMVVPSTGGPIGAAASGPQPATGPTVIGLDQNNLLNLPGGIAKTNVGLTDAKTVKVTATGSGQYCFPSGCQTVSSPDGIGGCEISGWPFNCLELIGVWLPTDPGTTQAPYFHLGSSSTVSPPYPATLGLTVFSGGSGTFSYQVTVGVPKDKPTDVCPLTSTATSTRPAHGHHRGVRPASAACLSVAVTAQSPHKGTASAGDRIRFTITPAAQNPNGTVLLTVTPPDKRHARLLKDTITGSYTMRGDNLEWSLKASSLKPVSFSVTIRADATIDDPLADNTLGVVATAVQGGGSAVGDKQLQLFPCGQNPPTFPSGDRSLQASGWTFKAEVDPRYGLALNDLRLTDLDGLGSRLVARRVSVPYLQLQTSRTTTRQFDTLVRLNPDGDGVFARSRLLKLSLDGTTAGDDSSRVFAVYGIDHLGPKSGSCLLITLSYEFKRYGTDTNCHPSAKIGYGDVALLKCSQFRPLLEYRFRGADGEKLVEIQTAQRLHLDIDGAARSMAMVLDRDVPTLVPGNLNFLLKKWVNPITVETRYEVIRHGQAGAWDNFHQRPALGKVDLPADLEDGIVRACGECFHMHWRWGVVAGGSLLPGLGGARPIIPEGSTQDAYVHLIKPRAGEEGTSLERLDDGDTWTPDDPIARGDVAFYWVAGNTQQRDAFFTHWTWAVPRTSAIAGVSSQVFALGTTSPWLCSVFPV